MDRQPSTWQESEHGLFWRNEAPSGRMGRRMQGNYWSCSGLWSSDTKKRFSLGSRLFSLLSAHSYKLENFGVPTAIARLIHPCHLVPMPGSGIKSQSAENLSRKPFFLHRNGEIWQILVLPCMDLWNPTNFIKTTLCGENLQILP